jgi:hypothetical protein
MPGNWDHFQHLNSGRVEWPTGPYNIDPNFAATWVDAWIVQKPGLPAFDLPGPSESTHGSHADFTPHQWTAPTPGWTNGHLRAGPALGIALMAMSNGAGAYEFDWWFKVVILQ